MIINELLEKVEDESSFINFTKALLNERYELEKNNPSNSYGSSHKGWENTTLEDYLDTAIAGQKIQILENLKI